MSKRKDIMKPVISETSSVMPFSDFSKSIRIDYGFAATKEKKEDKVFGNSIPPFPRSVLINKGYIKK